MRRNTVARLRALEQLNRALFYNLHFILIFIIPVVSMASLAEEKRSHSIRLLQTAPINASHIVMGKYAAGLLLMFLCPSHRLDFSTIYRLIWQPRSWANTNFFFGFVSLNGRTAILWTLGFVHDFQPNDGLSIHFFRSLFADDS